MLHQFCLALQTLSLPSSALLLPFGDQSLFFGSQCATKELLRPDLLTKVKISVPMSFSCAISLWPFSASPSRPQFYLRDPTPTALARCERGYMMSEALMMRCRCCSACRTASCLTSYRDPSFFLKGESQDGAEGSNGCSEDLSHLEVVLGCEYNL